MLGVIHLNLDAETWRQTMRRIFKAWNIAKQEVSDAYTEGDLSLLERAVLNKLYYIAVIACFSSVLKNPKLFGLTVETK